MPISLHAALVPSMLQILQAGKGWLAKAEACAMSESEVLGARLLARAGLPGHPTPAPHEEDLRWLT